MDEKKKKQKPASVKDDWENEGDWEYQVTLGPSVDISIPND